MGHLCSWTGFHSLHITLLYAVNHLLTCCITISSISLVVICHQLLCKHIHILPVSFKLRQISLLAQNWAFGAHNPSDWYSAWNSQFYFVDSIDFLQCISIARTFAFLISFVPLSFQPTEKQHPILCPAKFVASR